tara:strand:- start:93 stop:476 length:384 start_codon:yes stop_codon:yes gene_type:complete
MFNLVNLATAAISINSFSQYAFGVNAPAFLMGQKYGNPSTGYGNYQPGNKLSLAELVGFNQVGNGAYKSGGAYDQMIANLRRPEAFTKFMATQIGIMVIPKLIRKTGVTRRFNQVSKQLGLSSVVKA